jgi:hypothetical protein
LEYAPIDDVDIVIPLLLDPFFQEFFKTANPHPTESPPHLFWFDVHVTTLPVVLNGASKCRVERVTDMRVCICHVVILRAQVTLGDARGT